MALPRNAGRLAAVIVAWLAAGAARGADTCVDPIDHHAFPCCYQAACDRCSPGLGDAPSHLSTLIPASAFPSDIDGDVPIVFVDPGDGTPRRLVAMQSGRILVWNGSSLLATPFLDLTARVDFGAGAERGLLAVAVAPDYTTSGRFFVYYTGKGAAPGADGDIVVERYQRSADPNVADPTPTTVLVINHPQSNHNGGWLAFGPRDGLLYVSTGDGGGGCDSSGPHSQDTGSLLGKILRLDPDGDPGTIDCGNDYVPTTGYGIPASNPFVGAAGCDEVFAYGLRNPFRYSFDRQTGDLFVGDVGQSHFEEVDFRAGTATGAFNFGWVRREGCGTSAASPSSCGGGDPMSGPGCQYPTQASDGVTAGLYDPMLCHSDVVSPSAWHAVMGGYRYRGTRVSALAGRYVYGDTYCGQVWRTTTLDTANPLATKAECWSGGHQGTYGFAEDHHGELYLVDGGSGEIDCIHDGNGCPWATQPPMFEEDFELGNLGRWSAGGV